MISALACTCFNESSQCLVGVGGSDVAMREHLVGCRVGTVQRAVGGQDAAVVKFPGQCTISSRVKSGPRAGCCRYDALRALVMKASRLPAVCRRPSRSMLVV